MGQIQNLRNRKIYVINDKLIKNKNENKFEALNFNGTNNEMNLLLNKEKSGFVEGYWEYLENNETNNNNQTEIDDRLTKSNSSEKNINHFQDNNSQDTEKFNFYNSSEFNSMFQNENENENHQISIGNNSIFPDNNNNINNTISEINLEFSLNNNNDSQKFDNLNKGFNNFNLDQNYINNDIQQNNNISNNKFKYIKLSTFCYDKFEKIKNNNFIFNEPCFFPIEDIKKIKEIQRLWNGTNRIFNNEEEFDWIIKNGKINKNLLVKLHPPYQIELQEEDKKDDEIKNMSKKIMTFIINGIIESVNEFDEMKNNKLDKIGRSSIYNHSKREFILTLFEQKLFSIVSNDTKLPNRKYNYYIIEKIIKEYNENNENKDLIDHLCLTFREYFNIITFQEDSKINNNKFKKNIVDFLIETYKDKKIKLDIMDKKDYIVALLLLSYNYERFFYFKKSRKKN